MYKIKIKTNNENEIKKTIIKYCENNDIKYQNFLVSADHFKIDYCFYNDNVKRGFIQL